MLLRDSVASLDSLCNTSWGGVRAIIRDGSDAFLGSQSLRSLELDGRREVGLIVTDPAVVKPMRDTFEADWATTGAARKQKKKEEERAELPNGRTA